MGGWVGWLGDLVVINATFGFESGIGLTFGIAPRFLCCGRLGGFLGSTSWLVGWLVWVVLGFM